MVLWVYTACLRLAFGESCFAVLSLQWRHMSVVGQKSASYLLFVQHHILTNNKRNIQTLSLENYLCNKQSLHLWDYPCRCQCESAVVEIVFCFAAMSLQWRYMIECHGVPNLRPLDKLLNSMSWLGPKETSKLYNWIRNHLYYRNCVLLHCFFL